MAKKTLNKKALEVGKKIIDKNGQKVNDSITIEGYSFFIASTEKRRIKKVKVIKAS